MSECRNDENQKTGGSGRSFTTPSHGVSSFIRRFSPYMIFAIIAMSLLPYLAGLNGEFVFDDIELVKDDPFYRTESNPLKCWTRSYWRSEQTQGMYRPLTLFTYWLDARIFAIFANPGDNGLFSPGFRLINLILHAFVAVMVFKLALGLRFGRSTAFVAALIYAVHPIHVEAVTPTFGRGELLCAFFLLAALLLHMRAGDSLLKRGGAALCFMLSFMSKENGVIFLPMIVLIDIYLFPRRSLGPKMNLTGDPPSPPQLSGYGGHGRRGSIKSFNTEGTEGRKIKVTNSYTIEFKEKSPFDFLRQLGLSKTSGECLRIFLRYIPYVAVLAVVFCLRRYFLGSWLPAQQFFDKFIDNTIALSSTGIRIVSAIRIQGIALREFIWPTVLSHDYSYARILPVQSIFDIGAWSVAATFAAIPAIFATIFPADRRKVLLLVLLYIISILPAGNFIVPAGTIYAERLQYIPSIWLAVFAAMVFSRFSRKLRHPLPTAILALAILALSARTVMRTLDWKNSYTLAKSGVQTTPESLKTWNNYAVQLAVKGNLREAIAACDKALAIHDRYATGYANRGLFLAQLGDLKDAERDLRKALSLNTRHPAAAYNLGVLFMNTGRRSQAIAVWRHGIKYNPNDTRLRSALDSLKKPKKTNARVFL